MNEIKKFFPNLYSLQIHPIAGNNNFNFRNSNNRQSGRPPSGRGDEDCTFDWLFIPGGRGNLTKYGKTRITI